MDSSFVPFVTFTLISVAGQNFYLITSDKKILTLIDFIYFSGAVILNPLLAGFVALAGTLKRNYILLKHGKIFYCVYKMLFSFVSTAVFSMIYHACSESFAAAYPKIIFYNIFSFYMALTVYILIDSAAGNLYKILYMKVPFNFILNIGRTTILVYIFIIGPLGYLTSSLFLLEPLSLLVFLPPLLVMHQSINNYSRLLLEAKAMLEAIAFTNDKREPHADYHSLKVAQIARKIAYCLNLKESLINKIINASLIHDIGKISLPDKLLEKKELTENEFEWIKKHPAVGSMLASNLKVSQEETSFIKHHHEWYDGTGYPEGLKGTDIPIGARVIAVAEAFETLISRRSYREPVLKTDALKILLKNAGKQFDPKIVYVLAKTI